MVAPVAFRPHLTMGVAFRDATQVYPTLPSSHKFSGPNGEDLAMGFHVYNSEVGRGSAVVEVMMFNELDANGVINRSWGGYRQPHKHKKCDVAIKEMSEEIKNLTSNLEGIIRDVKDLLFVRVTNPLDLVEYICNMSRPAITKAQKECLDDAISKVGLATLWDVVNCFAIAGSRDTLSLEDRTHMMRIGGRILGDAKSKLRMFTQ